MKQVLIIQKSVKKHRRCERTQTGVVTPSRNGNTKRSPEGAKEHSATLSGFLLRVTFLRGLTPPPVVCHTFGACLLDASTTKIVKKFLKNLRSDGLFLPLGYFNT